MNSKNPVQVSLHPCVRRDQPFQAIHVDFAGPFIGTKWLEIFTMKTITSNIPIQVCEARLFNLEIMLVSDMHGPGPQFTSAEFAEFLACTGVKHMRSAP